jgi:dTDP-4-dehydrorhamnose reductase
MSSKTVLLGAHGLLGRHLTEEWRASELRALGRAECDITDAHAVEVAVAGASLVINCAAYTDVDASEREPQAASRANADGAGNVARASRAQGARCLHLSTDFVFDGEHATPYDEDDVPRPISKYGESKRAGEERALAEGAAVVRVQALYGRGGRGFASRLAELIGAQKPLKLDGERVVQPTSARAVARAIVALGGRATSGIYHVSCAGQTNWAAFARALAERIGVEPRFAEVRTAELKTLAARPRWCVFSHRRLNAEGITMPAWESALDEYTRELRA